MKASVIYLHASEFGRLLVNGCFKFPILDYVRYRLNDMFEDAPRSVRGFLVVPS